MNIKHLILSLLLVIGSQASFAQTPHTNNGSSTPVTATGSTTPRTLATRAADVINVLDYGVVCDGATDNSAAFTAVKNKSASGSTVYFPPATSQCLTSAAIVAKSGVTYFAYPGTVTIGPTSTSVSSPLLFTSANNTGVTVYGLTFDGGGQDFAGGAPNTVQSYRDIGTVFDHVTIQNTRGIGILFSGSAQSGLTNSTLNNIGNHWRTTNSNTDRAQGLSICCTGTFALSDNFVNNNLFINTGLDAISVGGSNMIISGNRCELLDFNQLTTLTPGPYSACVYANTLTGSVISNNYSINASGNGLDLYNSNNLSVTGNYIIASGSAGIGIFGNTNTSVVGNVTLNNNQSTNTCSTCSRAGISLSNGGSNITISGNVASDTQSTKTQSYGFQALANYTYYNIFVDQNNAFVNNLVSSFGGVITDFTPTHTAGGAFINAYGTNPNGSLQLQYSGTGEIDLADANGNTRFKATPTTVDSGITGSAGASFRASYSSTNIVSTDLTTYSNLGNTVTNNVAYAPNNTLNAASMIVASAATGLVNQYRYKSISSATGVLYTATVYFQAIPSSTFTNAAVYMAGNGFSNTSNNYGIVVNTNGCAYVGQPNGSSIAPTSYSITNVANGWCKVVVSQRAANTGGFAFVIANTSGSQVAFTGDGVGGVYVWGIYFETNNENFYTAKGAIAGSAAILSTPTAPTISSGFGTSPSIPSNQGTVSFSINVGTGGTASSGVIGMPTAPAGWDCDVHDVTSGSTNLTDQTGSTTTSVTFTNFLRSTGAVSAWPASDILEASCAPN